MGAQWLIILMASKQRPQGILIGHDSFVTKQGNIKTKKVGSPPPFMQSCIGMSISNPPVCDQLNG